MAGWGVAEGGGTSLRANIFTQGSPTAGKPSRLGGKLAPPATFGTGGTPDLGAWDFCVQIPALPLPSWVALGTLLNPLCASVSSPVPQSVPRAHCPCRLVVHPLLRGPTRVLRVRTGTRGHCWPREVTDMRGRLLAGTTSSQAPPEEGPARRGSRDGSAPSSAVPDPCALHTMLTATPAPGHRYAPDSGVERGRGA